MLETKAQARRGFGHLNFGFWTLFRISCFVFRIYALLKNGFINESKIVHHLRYPPDVDIHWAGPYASPASDACHTVIVLIHIVFQFVHEPLPHALHLLVPGIVARSMEGEERKHASIPVSDSIPLFSQDLILNVEAPAGGAEIGTGSAIDACKGDLFPERCIEKLVHHFGLELINRNPGGDLLLRGLGKNLSLS